MEAERPVRPGGEHPVKPERVKVHVEFQSAPEALHDGDRAALAVRDAGTPAEDGRQHGLDEVHRLLGHAPAAAARADRARFTGERHEALEPARVAPNAGEAPAERDAAEEVAELALDETRHACAVAGGGRLREEALEVRGSSV